MPKTVKLSPEEFAEKWAKRTKAATSEMSAGVDRVTEAPGKQAVAKKSKMQAKWNEAMDNGKWEENTAAYSLEDWKKDMKEKGVARVSQGVDRAIPKSEHFAEQLVEHQNVGLTKIAKMPDVTLGDSAARMVSWMEHMAAMKYRKG